MKSFSRLIGTTIVKTDALLRPFLFQREKKFVLKRFPALKPVLEAYERHYIRVEFGAHDRSLMERLKRNLTDKDEFVYGTTPWRAFIKITDALELGPEDVFIEPGCGTGHLCFFMNQVYGLRVWGVEMINDFIQTAKQMQQELQPELQGLDRLKFFNLDFFTCDFSKGTVFYIAGTCFPDGYRDKLVDKIARETPDGITLITLTHALEHPAFVLQQQVDAFFSWGRDKALIYKKQSN